MVISDIASLTCRLEPETVYICVENETFLGHRKKKQLTKLPTQMPFFHTSPPESEILVLTPPDPTFLTKLQVQLA